MSTQLFQHGIRHLFGTNTICRPFSANKSNQIKGTTIRARKCNQFMISTDRTCGTDFRCRQWANTGKSKQDIFSCQRNAGNNGLQSIKEIIYLLGSALLISRIIASDVCSPKQNPIISQPVNQARPEIVGLKIEHLAIKRVSKLAML